MFENYPKRKTILSKEFIDIYNEHYKVNRDGLTRASFLSQKMESWMHRKVASDVNVIHDKRTLEIGAGTLNQLIYEESNHYDIIEPFEELFLKSNKIDKINNIFKDIDDIKLYEKYDRITSIATFEHITDLPKVVAKACILLNPGGCLRTGIPNEGTILWRLGWQLTTGIEFKLKYGLNYKTLIQHEHVNNANEIEEVLNYFFENNCCNTMGPSKRMAFYRFYESKTPKIELAKQYLEGYNK